MVWIAIALILALIGAFVYVSWRIRRRRRPRLISFVALVREPVVFDPAILARIASKTWNADLGDGTSAGADGFVAGGGVLTIITHTGRMFSINSFPRPYTEDVE
jgi:hypothetical protein